jgi:phage terminase large subunit
MTSASVSIIPEFRTTLVRLEAEADFHITKNKITNLKTGSFIYFSGIKTSSGDQTARLKSIAGITTWVIEEGEDFKDEKAFDAIDDSIRTTAQRNRVIWIQNPTTKEHFIYKRWIEPYSKQVVVDGFNVTVSDHPGVEHIHTTYKIAERAGYLSPDWLAKARRYYDQTEAKVAALKTSWGGTRAELKAESRKLWHTCYYYYNYVGGWLEQAPGVVFDNWIEGDFDDSLPYVFGQDYGYSPDPLTLVKVAVCKRTERVYVDEWIYGTEIDDVVASYEAIDVPKNDLIVTDVNEGRTTSNIRKAGYNISNAAKGKGSIAEDIRDIKQYTIVVTPRSTNIKTEMNNYVWNDKKASVPIDEFNHALDAMRYAFRRLMKGRRKGVRKANR